MANDSLPVAEPESCTQCGHDGGEWNHQDTIRTIANAGKFLRRWTEDLDADLIDRRPEADVWSIGEYVHHIGDVFEVNELGMRISRQASGTVIENPPEPPPPGAARTVDLGAAIERVDAAATKVVDLLGELRGDDWLDHLILNDLRHDLVWASRHLVHDHWHHLVDIAAIRRDLGDGPAPQTGSVEHLHVSDGGVPKRAVPEVDVGPRGLVGDRQATRRHHGRPWQALCLWSGDVIDALRDEGHPAVPGGAGENITVRGLDWAALRAGDELEVGGVLCRLSADAEPCKKIAANFADGDFRRVEHDRHPGWSRWYAQVVRPGAIRTGDDVRVIA